MTNRTSDNVPHTEARATTSIIIMLSVKREVQRHEFLQLPSNEVTEKNELFGSWYGIYKERPSEDYSKINYHAVVADILVNIACIQVAHAWGMLRECGIWVRLWTRASPQLARLTRRHCKQTRIYYRVFIMLVIQSNFTWTNARSLGWFPAFFTSVTIETSWTSE